MNNEPKYHPFVERYWFVRMAEDEKVVAKRVLTKYAKRRLRDDIFRVRNPDWHPIYALEDVDPDYRVIDFGCKVHAAMIWMASNAGVVTAIVLKAVACGAVEIPEWIDLDDWADEISMRLVAKRMAKFFTKMLPEYAETFSGEDNKDERNN